jgi:hypothetical protein
MIKLASDFASASRGPFIEAVECSELRGGGAECKGARLLQGIHCRLVPLQVLICDDERASPPLQSPPLCLQKKNIF